MSRDMYDVIRKLPEFQVGVDIGPEDEPAVITVCRRPNLFELLMRKLKLSKATWGIKVEAERYDGPRSSKQTKEVASKEYNNIIKEKKQ